MAGLGRRTFAPGEVLTASNVMGYLQDQAVMNFAGTAARGSAIGTAVSEGMVSYLADSNVVQAYDGSAWNSLAYATAVPSASSIGLVPIVAPTVNYSGGTATANSLGEVAFTTVTSLSLNNIFTSNYSSYKVIIKITGAGASALSLYMRYRASGTDNSAATYNYVGPLANNSGSFVAIANTGQTFFVMGNVASAQQSVMSLDIMNPQINNWTSHTMNVWGHTGGAIQSGVINGQHGVNYQADGLTIYPSSSNISGTIQIFGYYK